MHNHAYDGIDDMFCKNCSLRKEYWESVAQCPGIPKKPVQVVWVVTARSKEFDLEDRVNIQAVFSTFDSADKFYRDYSKTPGLEYLSRVKHEVRDE